MSPAVPALVFDGDCGICTRLARVAERVVLPPPRGVVVPHQRADLAAYGLSAQECDRALQFVERSGRVSAAHDAVGRLLLSGPWWVRPAGAALLVPGVHALAGIAYRWIARNRHRLPGGTPACALPPRPPAGRGPLS